jgi:hypothetical protein
MLSLPLYLPSALVSAFVLAFNFETFETLMVLATWFGPLRQFNLAPPPER